MSTASTLINLTSSVEKAEVMTNTSLHELKRLDLSLIQADPTLSIHASSKMRILSDDLMASVIVMDFEQVHITEEASAALARSYLTPEYLLDRFGSHYKKSILAEVTRGNLKGVQYIDSDANRFVHVTGAAMDVIVSGKCVSLDGKFTRQIHITCAESTTTSATT